MAKIEMTGLDDYVKKLASLGANIEGVCKRAVYPAAGILIEEIKRSTPVDTGALRDSLILTPYRNEDGYIYTKVEFFGYDENGRPNPLKANVLESGSSRQPKRPFVRPAVNRVKGACMIEIEKNFNAILYEMMAAK